MQDQEQGTAAPAAVPLDQYWANREAAASSPTDESARLTREILESGGQWLRAGPFQTAVILGVGFAIGSGLVAAVVGFFAWAIMDGK